MVFAWLPKPYAGHIKVQRFRSQESVMCFVDMTVPHGCKPDVRIVKVGSILMTVAAVAIILFGLVAGGTR